MLIAGIVLLALLFLTLVPAATGMLAKRLGRSFALWFVIGILLPLVGVLILCFLPEQQHKNIQ